MRPADNFPALICGRKNYHGRPRPQPPRRAFDEDELLGLGAPEAKKR